MSKKSIRLTAIWSSELIVTEKNPVPIGVLYYIVEDDRYAVNWAHGKWIYITNPTTHEQANRLYVQARKGLIDISEWGLLYEEHNADESEFRQMFPAKLKITTTAEDYKSISDYGMF